MNQNPNNQNGKEALRWQFWFLVSFSLFVIVTFALYLPQRFLHQVEAPREEMMEEAGEHGEELHGLSQYHEEGAVKSGLAVNLNATPVPFMAGTVTRLDFFVNQKPGNVPVAYDELEVEHAKKIHVIGLRDDMNEFFHIHPQATDEPGILSVSHEFAKPGRYKVWSEIKKDGTLHSFGHPEMFVGGEGPRSEKKVSFARNVIVGNYQVALRAERSVTAGKEAELLFDVHTLDSFEVGLEPYLAADMHLTLIKDDWKQFIHTHPEGGDHHGLLKSDFNNKEVGLPLISEALANGGGHDTAEAGHGVEFHMVFPEPGLYKAFAQFRPKGIDLPEDEALTAEFWIEVKEGGLAAIPSWWLYLIISLILIAILSWGVSKYLQVKSQ